MYDRFHKKTSGLDPDYVRPAQLGSQLVGLLDPEIPVVSKADNRLVQDVEGLVANVDGTYVHARFDWHSDLLVLTNFISLMPSLPRGHCRSLHSGNLGHL